MQARQCFFLCAARKKTFARQKRSRFSDDSLKRIKYRCLSYIILTYFATIVVILPIYQILLSKNI
jgi:hypothetical protein